MRLIKTRFAWILLCVILPVSLYGYHIDELPLGTDGNRLFHIPGETFSNHPVVITDDSDFQDISSYLFYHFSQNREADATAAITQVFRDTEGRVCWGYHDKACWFKFDYVARISKPKDINVEALITGFPLTVQPDDEGTLLLYLDYPAGIISTTRLFSREKYELRNTARTALNALLLGMTLSLILYNCFIFFWTRDRSFLFFLLYLIVFSLHIYLREDYIHNLFPLLRDYYFAIPPFVFAGLFVQHFLSTKERMPVHHHIINGVVIAGIVLSVLSLFYRASIVLQTICTVYRCFVLFYILIFILYYSLKGIWEALYFLFAWVPLIVAVILLQLEQFGILQTNGPVLFFIMREGMYVSLCWQAVLLSIVLARKIKIFQQKTEIIGRQKKELEDLDQMKTRYIMNISHEFRSPLTLIIGTIENIQTRKLGDSLPWNHQVFSVMNRNAERLHLLVENTLKIMRMQMEKYDIKKETIPLESWLQILVSEFESLAKQNSISLSLHTEPGFQHIIHQDRSLLDTVFLNILSNAFKFTPEGGNIEITVTGMPKGMCTIEISDTGPGIPKDQLEIIFDRFYRVHMNNEKYSGGAGIGLALVRQSLDLMKGEVHARNNVNGGATFCVSLPYIRMEKTTDSHRIQTSRETERYIKSMDKGSHNKTKENSIEKAPCILIVEDNADLQEFLHTGLQDQFQIISATNGSEALRLFQEGSRPDLILCDVMMPQMDGIEFYKNLREKGFQNIPFIFLTARTLEGERIKAISEGAVDYIYKPFSLRSLTAKITSILLQQQGFREEYRKQIKNRIIAALDENDNTTAENQSDKQYLDDFITRYALSPREDKIVRLLYLGLRNKEIADKLGIASSTVSNLLSRIYKKTGTSGKIELVQKITGEKQT